MFESTVTSKGQTTLPRDIREHLGPGPGDRVRYIVIGEEVRLVRPRKVQSLCGALRHAGEPVALEDMDRAVRDGAAGMAGPARDGGTASGASGRFPPARD